MNEEALKEILNGHIRYIAIIVVIVNALGIIANAGIVYLLNRRFRKLEVRLRAIEAVDKAKIDYLHPKQADAAIEILNLLNKLEGRFDHAMLSNSLLPWRTNDTKFDMDIKLQAEKAILDKDIEVSLTFASDRSSWFNDAFNTDVKYYLLELGGLLNDDKTPEVGLIEKRIALATKKSRIETAVKTLLGISEA